MSHLSMQGYNDGGVGTAGAGSAWEGQMQSLATDAFQKNQIQDMRDDVSTSITTSSHYMNQGGPICQEWTEIEGPFTSITARTSLLNLDMSALTGNRLAGAANLFNQYYLCRLRKLQIIFKDIVLATEASTNVGLAFHSDIASEFKRIPQAIYFNGGSGANRPIVNFPANDQPVWWQDWRPATDGAVEFDFDVSAVRWLPTCIVCPRQSPVNDYKDPSLKTFGQYLYNFSVDEEVGSGFHWTSDAIPVIKADQTTAYNPYICAGSNEWLDFGFMWRARNCPNSQSGVITSAAYNIQVNCTWDMKYRQTSICPSVLGGNVRTVNEIRKKKHVNFV